MNCENCGKPFDCGCSDPEYTCGGCNWEVSADDLASVGVAMARLGLDPRDGLMCPNCFVSFLAEDWAPKPGR